MSTQAHSRKNLETIKRIFKLIRLLNNTPSSISTLATRLNVVDQTIYKYIRLLKDLGYPVEKDASARYFIQFESSIKANELNQEELAAIEKRLQNYANVDPEIQKILVKINKHSRLIPLSDTLIGLKKAKLIRLIEIAIELQKRIYITNYQSTSSNTIQDRYVEPCALTKDAKYLIAWDLDKERQSQFKLDRMSDITITEEDCTVQHPYTPMDLFGLTGDQEKPVTLKLTEQAHFLLIEEFPLSHAYIKRKTTPNGDPSFLFEGHVRSWKGIGRFVLGLMGEVEVLKPLEFRDYLNKRIKQF